MFENCSGEVISITSTSTSFHTGKDYLQSNKRAENSLWDENKEDSHSVVTLSDSSFLSGNTTSSSDVICMGFIQSGRDIGQLDGRNHDQLRRDKGKLLPPMLEQRRVEEGVNSNHNRTGIDEKTENLGNGSGEDEMEDPRMPASSDGNGSKMELGDKRL